MLNKNDLQIGINLGGWISQYPAYDHSHFKAFITESDIKRIAEWGFDHVRLPVDYPVLEDDNQPGVLKTSGLDYIHNCLDWCGQNNLRAILDLHKAPGFAFDEHEQSTLFDNPALQERFINLWRMITREFTGKMDDGLAFELLNEISLPESSPWNALVKKTAAEIRKIDPQRLILVGGNYYNSVDELQNLDLLADDNILYTFHFYLPITLTHQKAPWLAPIYEYNHTLDYPGQKADGLEEIFKKYPGVRLADEIGVSFNKNYLRSKLQPAIEFMKKTGHPLYCGEFGVYEIAPMSARLNWTRDVVDLLNEYHISRAIWTYKALDFGLVDKNGKVINEELVRIASRR